MKEIWAFTQHSIEYCVVVAHDRNGQILSQVAGKGRVTATELDGVLGEYLDNSALLCTDTATNYKNSRL